MQVESSKHSHTHTFGSLESVISTNEINLEKIIFFFMMMGLEGRGEWLALGRSREGAMSIIIVSDSVWSVTRVCFFALNAVFNHGDGQLTGCLAATAAFGYMLSDGLNDVG